MQVAKIFLRLSFLFKVYVFNVVVTYVKSQPNLHYSHTGVMQVSKILFRQCIWEISFEYKIELTNFAL